MIVQVAPDSAAAMSLISELEEELAARYPAHHRHGFTAQRLARENIPFFVVHAEVGRDDIRIVSARRASPAQRRIYDGLD